MRLTRLLPEDEPALRVWTRDFLADHLRWWSAGIGLGWTEADVQRHIDLHGLAEKDLARLIDASAKWETNLLVIARDDAPIGGLWAESRVDPFLAVEVGVIAWIHVTPEARGRGVGSALVAASQDWMRERGLSLVQLNVVAANAAAVRMYEKSGLRALDLRMWSRL